MKVIGLLCLLFPTVTLASALSPNVPETSATVYTCHALTDNEVDSAAENFEAGLLTDNPIQNIVTEITESATGYTISHNDFFSEDVVLTNPRMKQMGNYASNTTTMLFKKTSPNGLPFFIVLSTGKGAKANEKPAENPITRMVTVARCGS